MVGVSRIRGWFDKFKDPTRDVYDCRYYNTVVKGKIPYGRVSIEKEKKKEKK